MTKHASSAVRLSLLALGCFFAATPGIAVAQHKPPAKAPPPTVRQRTDAKPSVAATPTVKDSAGKNPAENTPARAWRLRVSEAAPFAVTLRAKDASLAEVAAEMSAKMKTPIQLSPLMRNQELTLSLDDMPVEGALRQMAPQVFVDYLVSGEPGAASKIVAVYLFGFNEMPPAESIAAQNNAEVFMIEGNTEDGVEAEVAPDTDDKPLQVDYANNLLSVRARKQPLTVALYEIASKLGVAFDMQYESSELVNLDLRNYTVEDAVKVISPLVRLYTRTDLQTLQSKPLRLVLVRPERAGTANN